jgi:ApaG protein
MKAFFPFAMTTRDITVRVSVSFLADQSDPQRSRWFWAYHIRIENDGPETVQLLTRNWFITDGNGLVSEVEGDGVVGEQPVLIPGASFDYVSGCPLATPTGNMVGTFGMITEADEMFDIAIPQFPLVAPTVST